MCVVPSAQRAVPDGWRVARRLFAGPPQSGLWDDHIVNGISGRASIAQNSVCVLRALFPLAACRCGPTAGAAALALLWALAVASSPAAALGEHWRHAGPGRDLRSWSRAPIGWLRQSRDTFQEVMRKLARRSAALSGPTARPEPDGPPVPPDRQEPDAPWSTEEPRGRSPQPRPGGLPEQPGERPAQPSGERRHSAAPTRERPGTRPADHPPGARTGPWVNEWAPRVQERQRSWSASCRGAGVPVRGAGWYVVAPGDTLWRIARVHYGSGGSWRRLLRANSAAIRHPDLIYACQHLLVPGWGVAERPPCDDPYAPAPRLVCHRPDCEEPRPPPRSACHSPPPRPGTSDRRAPGGCLRCGAGTHAGAWGWR